MTPEGSRLVTKPVPVKILTYDEMLAMPEPDFLVFGVVPRRGKTCLFGVSNSFNGCLEAKKKIVANAAPILCAKLDSWDFIALWTSVKGFPPPTLPTIYCELT